MCIFYRKMFVLVLYSELVIGWKQIKEEMNKQKGKNPRKIETMKIVMEVKYETEMNWVRFNTIAKMVNDEQS